MLLEKEFAYLLNRCYNLHKAFPLVFRGRLHFHYNTWGYAFFFVFFQICSFIAKYIKRIEQCGASYKNGILLGPDGYDNFSLINHAIDCKTKKLHKGGYDKFNEYHLFIFSSILASKTMLKDELSYLEQNGISSYFKKIYVHIPGALLYFDISKSTYEVFGVDSSRQLDWAMKARQMVEDGEKG